MQNGETSKTFSAVAAALVAGAAATAAIILVASIATIAVPNRAEAKPEFSQRTGQPCAKCHTAPPALNAYGKKFKDNGFK
jgi:hypothetical protein